MTDENERRIERLQRQVDEQTLDGGTGTLKQRPLTPEETAAVKAALREFYEGLDPITRAILV